MEDPFDALRSLMQQRPPDPGWRAPGQRFYTALVADELGDAWRASARELLIAAHKLDHHRYEDALLPHLTSFEAHWRCPLVTHDLHSGLDAAAHKVTDIAPFASFAFVANSNTLNGSRLREPAKFEPFAQSFLCTFDHVDVSDHAVFAEGARTISRSAHLEHVVHLALVRCFIGDDGFEALVRSTSFDALEVLDVSLNQITDEGVERACASWNLTRLRALRIVGEHVGERALRALADAAGLGALEEVWVGPDIVDLGDLERQAWWRERTNRFAVVAVERQQTMG